MSNKGVIGIVAAVALLLGGVVFWVTCVPAYNVPKFESIDTNETGFLIPLDADGKEQTNFDSVDYLKDRKVATKRVQIPRRWVQTGRLPATGEYQDTLRLVKVNRSPVIRQWVQAAVPGTSSNDDNIEATSKDGIEFAFGFTCTAQVIEEDTSTFLYWYKGDQLSEIMDREFRARVQTVAAEYCPQHGMDSLRGQQNKIMDEVREDMVPFFKKRGIEITNLGIVGGFRHKNPAVQQAIDRTVQDQQLKVSAEAKREAQLKENETIKLAAEGQADAARARAKGEADAIKMVAEAKAFELDQAKKDVTLYVNLKTLELEKTRLEKWDGHYPTYFMGTQLPGQAPNLLMTVPQPPPATPKQ